LNAEVKLGLDNKKIFRSYKHPIAILVGTKD